VPPQSIHKNRYGILILAILLVFVGVVLIFINKTQEGIVSSIASIVSGSISGLALAFNKQTNDRLDEYARELVALEKSYTGMHFISLISDVRMKDEAIRDLAKTISMRNQASWWAIMAFCVENDMIAKIWISVFPVI
jgi:hypothetical protein